MIDCSEASNSAISIEKRRFDDEKDDLEYLKCMEIIAKEMMCFFKA